MLKLKKSICIIADENDLEAILPQDRSEVEIESDREFPQYFWDDDYNRYEFINIKDQDRISYRFLGKRNHTVLITTRFIYSEEIKNYEFRESLKCMTRSLFFHRKGEIIFTPYIKETLEKVKARELVQQE